MAPLSFSTGDCVWCLGVGIDLRIGSWLDHKRSKKCKNTWKQ
jgi:hypothetical protein